VYKEAKSLAQHGYEVIVMCWSKSGDNLPAYEKHENIKIIRIKHDIPPPEASRIVRAPMYLKQVWKMVAKTRELKPDIIHCHDADTLLEGFLSKLILKAPLIYDAHEDFPASFKGTLPLVYIGTSVLEKIIMGYIDYVITVTDIIGNKFRRYGKEVFIVYNARPLEDVRYISNEAVADLRTRLGLRTDEFVVGIIGAIGPSVGQHKLIEALKYIFHKDVRVLIVGGLPEHMDWLKTVVKKHKMEDKVILIHQVPYNEVMKYYKLTNVGCVLYQPNPNNEAGAPNKLFEFMSAGIPIIASDFPEYRKILMNEAQCAIMVDPTDSHAIAGAVDQLIDNYEYHTKLATNISKMGRTKYNWEKQEEKLFKLYDTIKRTL
jgi:glycosyltransferase involved in cell wall biosynthesis